MVRQVEKRTSEEILLQTGDIPPDEGGFPNFNIGRSIGLDRKGRKYSEEQRGPHSEERGSEGTRMTSGHLQALIALRQKS